MSKDIIIGAGFSSLIAFILLQKKVTVYSPRNESVKNNISLKRRVNLDFNKLFSKTCKSFGTLNVKLFNGKLHDRINHGGNSQVWGGAINIKGLPNNFLNLLLKNNILLKKLSLNVTGSISNDKNLYQLQDFDSSILSAEKKNYKNFR